MTEESHIHLQANDGDVVKIPRKIANPSIRELILTDFLRISKSFPDDTIPLCFKYDILRDLSTIFFLNF